MGLLRKAGSDQIKTQTLNPKSFRVSELKILHPEPHTLPIQAWLARLLLETIELYHRLCRTTEGFEGVRNQNAGTPSFVPPKPTWRFRVYHNQYGTSGPFIWGYTVSTTTIAVYLSLTSKPSSSIAHSPNILPSHSRTCALRQHVPILACCSGFRGAEYGKYALQYFGCIRKPLFRRRSSMGVNWGQKLRKQIATCMAQARERESALVLEFRDPIRSILKSYLSALMWLSWGYTYQQDYRYPKPQTLIRE